MAIDRELLKKLEDRRRFLDFQPKVGGAAARSTARPLSPFDKEEEPKIVSQQEQELDVARANAAKRILSDPIATQGKPSWYIEDIERIASGGKPKDEGGIKGILGKVVGGALEGVGYVMNRPLAAVASAGKEISDIFTEGDASFADFFEQAIDKDTSVSKYLPKTDIDWLDKTIGFVADVALDPLTYVGFGATKFAGRSGRLELAAQAASKEMLEKVPTLAAKVADGRIARLGEWALDAAEREALGLSKRPGLHWAFGKQGVIGKEGTALGKVSELAATGVGKTFANVRAGLSDTGIFKPFQQITTKGRAKAAGLTMYGRVAESAEDINRIAQLAAYSASARSKGISNFVSKKFGSQFKQTAAESFKHERTTNSRIHEVIEGVRSPVNETEAALAEQQRKFFSETLDYSNSSLDEFAGRRSASAQPTPARMNYVPHFLSDEAIDAIRNNKVPSELPPSLLNKILGMNVKEFLDGPGIVQERTLKTGDTFLGKKLVSDTGDGAATIREINDIAKEKLKFALFEEDSSKYMARYLDSVVDQTKRLAFVDRLFDYGSDVVRAVTEGKTGVPSLDRQWTKIVNGFDNLMSPVFSDLAGNSKEALSILRPRLQFAEALASLEPGSPLLDEKQISKIARVLKTTFRDLDSGYKMLESAPADVKRTYRTLFDAAKRNLDATNAALTAGDHEELVSRLGLRDLYSRFIPDAEPPRDPRALAEDILDIVEEQFGVPSTRAAREAAGGIAEAFRSKVAADTGTRAQESLDMLRSTMRELPRPERAAKRAELDVLKSEVDAAGSLRSQRKTWDETIGKIYGDDIQNAFDLVRTKTTKGGFGEINSAWVDRVTKDLTDIQGYGAFLAPEEADALGRIVTQMRGLESKLAVLEADKDIARIVFDKMLDQNNIRRAAGKTIEGWTQIEQLGVQMPPDVRELMFGKMEELATAQGASKFAKMARGYDNFFALTAMLSPGFIARNSYTAAMNNFVAGVSVKETLEGLRFATKVLVNRRKGGLSKVLEGLPAAQRQEYEEALKIAFASGTGQTVDDIISPAIRGGKKLKLGDAFGVRHWAEVNESVELAFRFSLGLSSVRKNMDFGTAVEQISRYQFDYGDLSSLDVFMKKFIPFWIFASRNIPLQMVNTIARPSRYRMYESLQRNFGATEEEMQNYPEWLRRRGPLRFPGMAPGTVINPDLPQLDMEEQIGMMVDPLRLLSQATPRVKLPIELLLTNRQLWNDVPFSEKNQPVRGVLDYPAYAAGSLANILFPGNAGQYPATGEKYTSSKAAYAAANLMPTLAQLQRLLPSLGGKEAYQDRAGSSRAAFFGLPYRKVSKEEQFNELTRRQFAISNYLSELTKQGKLMPKEQ